MKTLRIIMAVIVYVMMALTAPLSSVAEGSSENKGNVRVSETMEIYDPDDPDNYLGWVDQGEQTELDGDIDIAVTASDAYTTALQIDAGEEDDTSFTVQGSIAIDVETDEAWDTVSAVRASSENENAVDLRVTGDVSATSVDTEGTDSDADSEAYAIRACSNGEEDSVVSVEVDGNVSAMAIASENEGHARSIAVEAVSRNECDTVNVTIGKDVSASAEADQSAYTAAIYVEGPGTNIVTVDGNATAYATSANGDIDAYAVFAFTSDGDSQIHVKGDVEAKAVPSEEDDTSTQTQAVHASTSNGANRQ